MVSAVCAQKSQAGLETCYSKYYLGQLSPKCHNTAGKWSMSQGHQSYPESELSVKSRFGRQRLCIVLWESFGYTYFVYTDKHPRILSLVCSECAQLCIFTLKKLNFKASKCFFFQIPSSPKHSTKGSWIRMQSVSMLLT